MRQFNVLFRWGWTFLVVVTLGLAGCDGDDGAAGAAGAAGLPGDDGDPGIACWDLDGDGEEDPEEDINGDNKWDAADCAGTAAKVTPLESCGVCHSEGSFADATANHALPPIETYSNVALAVNGLDLDVTFDLAADTVPATNYDTLERGYRTDGTVRTDICNGTNNVCDPASLTLTNNGGGNYTIKVLGGAAEAANDNRYLFRVSAGSERVTRLYLYGDFPASPVEDLAISAQACNACHGPEGINVHGGYFAKEDGGEPCLACHGLERPPSDPIPPLFEVAHQYHSSLRLDDQGQPKIITFPTYMSNCSVCHSEDAQLAAANAMSVSAEHCFSCHGSMENPSWKFNDPQDNLSLHLGFTDPETVDCTVCHDGNIAPATVAAFHNDKTENLGTDLEELADQGIFIDENSRLFGEPLLDNDGVLWNGEDTSVTEGEKFDWQITNVVDDETNLAISWTASYNGIGVDPCNATVAAGAPVFHVGRPRTIRIYRNYAQGDDFILGPSETSTGGASRVNVDEVNTACVGNVATTTIPVEDTVADRGRVALGGKPLVVNVADPAGTMVARVPTPTYDWLIGTSNPAPARRYVVDTAGKCLQCHVGSLYQHGGDRVDNVDVCMLCHNAAANEQYVRVSMGVDASEAYDGKVGESFELKTMLHRVHSAGAAGSPPYLVYRSRGIYAFAPDESLIPNWPGEGDQVVFGSDFDNDGLAGSFVTNHHFHAPTFPRRINECTACHTEDDPDTTDVDEGFTVIPDQTKSMAVTTDAGSTDWDDRIDDVLQGAAATACITCHKDAAAKGHAYQNSWTPQAFPEGRQTIIDAVN